MTHEMTDLRLRRIQQRLEALEAALAQQAEPVHDRHGACPTHCCPVHGCKYMHDDCPVVSGCTAPVYPRNNGCESCADDALAQQAEPQDAELRRLSAVEAQRDEARRTVREAHEAGTRVTAQRDALLEALKEIADADPVDAALDPQLAVRIARAAIKAVDEAKKG